MSDNKTKTGVQDRIKVDSNDINEVEYIHQQYPGFTHAEILDAVKKNGPYRDDIMKYLSSRKKNN